MEILVMLWRGILQKNETMTDLDIGIKVLVGYQ